MNAPLPRNGCHNRPPFVDTVVVQHGWHWHRADHRTEVLRTIANPMSKDCQYSRTTVDARCDGCKWRSEVADIRSDVIG